MKTTREILAEADAAETRAQHAGMAVLLAETSRALSVAEWAVGSEKADPDLMHRIEDALTDAPGETFEVSGDERSGYYFEISQGALGRISGESDPPLGDAVVSGDERRGYHFELSRGALAVLAVAVGAVLGMIARALAGFLS